MSKKKKKNGATQMPSLSPAKYLKEKARSLAIGKCYISEDIETCGEGNVIVTRMHKHGKVSVGVFLVDIFCLGVKDAFYMLRMEEYEFEHLKERFATTRTRECSYEEAHNWIYGAIAFAEEGGINPHPGFTLAQYLLEEDTDDVPLIEYDFGKDGKHLLIASSKSEANKYVPTLKKNLGDNFEVIIRAEDDEDEYDENDPDFFDDVDEMTSFDTDFSDSPMIKSYGSDMKYTYVHPDYPQILTVENQWVLEDLLKPENALALKDTVVDEMLALPKESLRKDLENIIMYYIGLTCDEIPQELKENYTGVVSNATMMLAEVGNDSTSLDVVLELLRQSPDFYDYHFGDAAPEIVIPTLYKLGQHKLDVLMDYLKEEGLYTYAKINVLKIGEEVNFHNPDRREEVIDWYHRLILFTIDALPQSVCCDATVAGFLVNYIVDMGARELLPSLKDLFATNMVDIGSCGSWESVKRDLSNPAIQSYRESSELDIHKLFKQLVEMFN